MKDDPIVAEVRRIRHEHAVRFRYDLTRSRKISSARAGKRPIIHQLAPASYETENAPRIESENPSMGHKAHSTS